MNTIVIELCAEDRQRLDKILEAMLGRPDCQKCVESATTIVASVAAAEPHKPEEPAKTVERADIQRRVVELSSAGKKAEAREVVNAYAKNVSGIPEDKLAEVWEQLEQLS